MVSIYINGKEYTPAYSWDGKWMRLCKNKQKALKLITMLRFKCDQKILAELESLYL